MSSLTTSYGLNLVTPYPSGPGGSAIQSNFESLVQWSPKSSHDPSATPTTTDDSSSYYNYLSMWLTIT
jgi:hypothetical protein